MSQNETRIIVKTTLSQKLSFLRYRLRERLKRIMHDCRNPAGWHPLLVLTVEDTLEQARETFTDHPELPRLIAEGCTRVGDKWASYGDDLYLAKLWATDLAEEYAAQEGITLVHFDGEETTATPQTRT